MFDYIDYKLLFFGEDVIQRIESIKRQTLFVIGGINKRQEHDSLLFSKNKKIYTVNNVMKLASCTTSDDDDEDADEDEHNHKDHYTNKFKHIDTISVLTYGILNEGWSKTTIRYIENELVDRCLIHQYITEEEHKHYRKKEQR